MQLATAMNLRKAMDEETKRERFASWYSTLPGIPAHEKEIIERSLKYNVWKELIKLFVVYMIFSLVWFFGAGQYDPFESVTGYSLIGKKSVIGVVQEDGESLRLKNPNKGEHVSYTLAELGMDPIKYSYGSRFQTYWEKEKNGEYQLLAVLPEKQVSKIEGVGRLVEMGVKLGRKTNADLKVGICGEHGGEPSSVIFCDSVGMNYVSCSPFRVPIARVAAAQAAIMHAGK